MLGSGKEGRKEGAYVYMHVCVCACACVHVHACMCICMCLCLCLSAHISMIAEYHKYYSQWIFHQQINFVDGFQNHTAVLLACPTQVAHRLTNFDEW